MKNLQQPKVELSEMINSGILSADEVANLKEIFMKKEMDHIREKVKEFHKYEIKPIEIDKKGDGNKQTYYQTYAPWKSCKKIRKKNIEDVYKELSEYYGIKSFSITTVKDVFNQAFEYKCATEILAPRYKIKLIRDYNRYISDDFAKMDIKDVTTDFLNTYSADMVTEKSLPVTAFMNYKTLLNLIFEHALYKGFIKNNPVSVMKKNRVFLKGCRSKVREYDYFTPEWVKMIKDEIQRRATDGRCNRTGYDIEGYAMLLSSVTGVREAELCALKWEDIKDRYIWIHRQQHKDETKTEDARYYDVPYTKGDVKRTGKGRYYPLFPEVVKVLDELRAIQDKLGIHGEYLFTYSDGGHLTTEGYENALRAITKKLGIPVHNNHAFRKHLNVYILIEKYHLDVHERAAILGHSVETNLRYYTVIPTDYIDDILSKTVGTREGTTNIIPFCQEKKSQTL